MQVSVESGDGLERKLKVQIPAEKLDIEVESRLKSMMSRVKVDGFRPGKVPLSVVKQRYGNQVFQEVAGELLQSSLHDALTQENLRPASDPDINVSSLKPGSPVEYIATFEIYPEIELKPISQLKLDKVLAIVDDADVTKMLDTLRKQRATWSEVDRASADGDRITISFIGKINNEPFAGGSAENTPLVLGSGAMIPGFEDQLVGLAAGDEKTIKVTFPEDYSAKDLAGKDSEFGVTINRVEVAELPSLDEEFARSFGIEDGDVSKLTENVRANMERELKARINSDVKAQVMDKLLEHNPVDVPDTAVREEAKKLKQKESQNKPGFDRDIEYYMDSARRRVTLGMIMIELIKLAAIKIDKSDIENKVDSMSKDYEDPDEFVRYYMGNPQLMRDLESLVLEDKIVDWVVSQASVTEITKSFDQVVNSQS